MHLYDEEINASFSIDHDIIKKQQLFSHVGLHILALAFLGPAGGTGSGLSLADAFDARPSFQIGENIATGVPEEHPGRPDTRHGLFGKQVQRPVIVQVEEVEPRVLPSEFQLHGRDEGEVLRHDGREGDDVDGEEDGQGLVPRRGWRRDGDVVALGKVHDRAPRLVALVRAVHSQVAPLLEADAPPVVAREHPRAAHREGEVDGSAARDPAHLGLQMPLLIAEGIHALLDRGPRGHGVGVLRGRSS